MRIALPLLYVLVALSAYRIARIVNADTWPPVFAFRKLLVRRFGAESGWYEFFRCHWCFGTWAAIGVTFLVHYFAVNLLTGRVHNRAGFVAVVAVAVASVVGFIGDGINP